MKKFEVGMKVLCVKDHSQEAVKKGQEYRVLGIKENKCCGSIVLDVGVIAASTHTKCTCGNREKSEDGVWWINNTLFVPIEEFQQITYTKIIEQIPIGVN